jgi:octaprenyl-diphosphate synthase
LVSDLPCVNELTSHIERYRGKMLRPMLVLATAMAGSESGHDATHAHRVAATVMEMVHMATLVHDDVLDDSHVRRSGATVNRLNGNETAVMLGDYLISHAYHLCSSIDHVATGVAQPVSRIVADTTNTVCEGELLQLANRDNWELDEGTYFEIIRRKTASLCGCCCRVAALLNGADEDMVDRLESFGEKVGVAFQIVDDLLDLDGTTEELGKQAGADAGRRKMTWPAAVGESAARADAAELVDGATARLGEGPGAERLSALGAWLLPRRS